MSMLALRPQSGARTHEGRVRQLNEDSFCAREEIGLWAIADGMGGHDKGEWASALIIEELAGIVLPEAFEASCNEIAERIHRANRIIFEKAEEQATQIGSTIVALYVRERRFAILWVGDSRAYLLRGGVLHQLSRDHSQVQEMVDRGLLRPEEAESHPMSHILARAVGVADTLEVDVVQDEVEPGDTFLLCSDGLHGYVPESEIAAVMHSPIPADAAGRLVDATLECGAPDNVTVITVRFSEPTLLALEPAETR
ncbi:MAG: protein phosphatase 2C domain-containing protein [Allosphingosinicella sp.]